MQWLRQFIAKNPAKVFRDGPEPITMGIRNVKRKVKFFAKKYDTDTLVTIIVLAHQLDLDVTECLGIAYEEIKNRKGKMINGTFVKEEDL